MSPISFTLYPRSKHVSSSSPFLAGYYGFYNDFIRALQIATTPSPAGLLSPLSSPALVPATDTKTNEVDRTRNIKREESIKHEEEQELRHKEIAMKVRDAIGSWIHACQKNKATNASTWDDKPALFKQEMKSLSDITNKCPTIVLLMIKKPFIPETMTPLSPSWPSHPSLVMLGVTRMTTRCWGRQMMKQASRVPPSMTRTRKMIWNLLAAPAQTIQCCTPTSLQIPSVLAFSWHASGPVTTPPLTQSRHTHQPLPVSLLFLLSKKYSMLKDGRLACMCTLTSSSPL